MSWRALLAWNIYKCHTPEETTGPVCKTPDHKQRGLCLYININQSSESHSFEERLRSMAEWWDGGKEHMSERKSRTLVSKDTGISPLIENTSQCHSEREWDRKSLVLGIGFSLCLQGLENFISWKKFHIPGGMLWKSLPTGVGVYSKPSILQGGGLGPSRDA